MNIEELKIIINEQKADLNNIIFKRSELNIIDYKAKLIKIITGPRRAGKSYFLLSLGKEIYNNRVLYVNFDDVRLSKFKIDDFNNLIIAGNQIIKEFKTIFFDEIQNVNGWEKFVNTLAKTYNVFITGSNSKLLSKELGTFLTGRHTDFLILPFTFKDIITIKDKNKIDKYNLKDISKIKKHFDDYMIYGGYPDVVLNRGLDLNILIKDVIYKDIIYRYTIKEKSVIESLAIDLLYKYGKYFSYTKEAEQFSIAPETIKNYISYLEDAYLLFVLPKFSYSHKSQEQSTKKVYAIDVGFINRIAKTEYDKSKVLENIVAIELFRKRKELYYWKDYSDKECDFLIAENGKPKELVQVSWELNENNEKREINGIMSAMNEFNLKEGLILTYDTEKTITIDKKNIIIKPVWKWLLE
ncbi:MAG: hypothetical protein COT14_02290 [Candidatus Diapherotrites archaeon CG08_land_8_20_14_0_20_30_16]|nr:MAG: hypothetical protein COT14_02290 [Candidatus Diapherotrites archaeon CG08_land_8_20_14_0_20_30_16]